MKMKAPSVLADAEVSTRLAAWYEMNHRPLPWRQTRDAYAIWVSETMLQQTRVETVIPYYHTFLSAFPTVAALAEADSDHVLKLWQGLGYYSRARNLQRAAQQVVALHGGVVPDDAGAFGRLPGVGPYTCGAVQSIAFGNPVPAVDGNVLRVVTRVLALREEIEQPSVKRAVTAQVARWLQAVDASTLTQALMELGATVCMPKSPRCGMCPIQAQCVGRSQGIAEQLPARRPKRARKQVEVLALFIAGGGRVCIEQRPADGLLADMWQLPAVEVARDGEPLTEAERTERLQAKLTDLFGSSGDGASTAGDRVAGDVAQRATRLPMSDGTLEFARIASAKHIFTHIEWQVDVYRPVGDWNLGLASNSTEVLDNGPIRMVPFADLPAYAWPRVYDKLLNELSAPLEVFASTVVK